MTGWRRLARWSVPALLLGVAAAGCRRDKAKIDEAAAERAAEKKPSGEAEAPGEAPAKADIASSPAELLKPGAVKRIQDALADRGHLDGRPGGGLDGPTRLALRKFQRAQKLPETGLPDHETIRKLGLAVDDVFLKNVSGAEAAANNENRRTDDGEREARAEREEAGDRGAYEREAKEEQQERREERAERQGRRARQEPR